MKKVTNLFNNLNDLQKILVVTILAIFLYGSSASAAYSVFSKVMRTGGSSGFISSIPTATSTLEEDPNEPKTEQCPLNGNMHTKAAKEAWEKRRPLAIMVENHQESRPQSGLSSADIVYEAIAEGGITRFMALYYCNLSDVQVGPVRSARTYFLDWLGEYDALYAHVGGANTPGPADALSQIIKYRVKDLNQFSIGFPIFWRDYQRLGHTVATEHTMYSTTQKLWEIGSKRGWVAEDEDGNKWDENFTLWKFKDGKSASSSQVVKVPFWESQGAYTVLWVYDSTSNSYKRKHDGSDHTDLNNKKQLEAKNVVIQFERESNANDGYENNVHLLYGTTGTGKVLIFQNGTLTEGKWTKATRISRTKYTDSGSKEVEFVRGVIWIQTVPEGSNVTY